MLLSQLLENLPSPIIKIKGPTDRQVDRIVSSYSYDFDEHGGFSAENRTLFVHLGPLLENHVLDYENNRVAVLIVDRDIEMPAGTTVIRVMNTFEVLGLISSRFFGMPSNNLTLIGVTGTNGKTTTTHLIEGILKSAGHKTALFGTLQYRLDESITARADLDPHHLTTPLPEIFNQMLFQASKDGITHVVMEVSSQSLREHRVKGCHFDLCVFTNLSREHQDFHLDMHDYTESKLRLFTEVLAQSGKVDKAAILNLSDKKIATLKSRIEKQKVAILGYAVSKKDFQKAAAQTVFCQSFKVSEKGIKAVLSSPMGKINIRSPLLGHFNLQNILAAVCVGIRLNLDKKTIEKGIRSTLRVPGRLERIPNDFGIKTYFDWAHTEMAFADVLTTLKKWKGKGNLRVLFGCEDNMDSKKRQGIAKQAGRLGNVLYISLENLLDDEALLVRKQMERGLKGSKAKRFYFNHPMEALKQCLKDCKRGDTAVAIGWEIEHVEKAREWLKNFQR